MNMRSVAFGTALTIGGLVGVASASSEAMESPELSAMTVCENNAGAKLCSGLGRPVEAYVAMISQANIAGDNEAGSDILRAKAGAVASGAGSLILLCAACQHVIESRPSQTRRAAG